MASLMIQIAPVSAIMLLSGSTYYLNNKRKYKAQKKKIYKHIRSAIIAQDYEDIIKGFELLKEFDTRHSNEDGEPNRKYFEKISFRKRISKCEKSEKLFGIPNDVITDVNKLKKYFSDKLKKEDLKQNLEAVQEEEKAESETLIILKKKMSKIKTRHLAENNSNRKIIDEMNLTEMIRDIHSDYEELFITTFEQEHDLQNILQRSVKKQILMNKMNKIKNKKKQGNLRSC